MLLSRNLAHAAFVRQVPLTRLLTRFRCPISEQASTCGHLPPPDCVAGPRNPPVLEDLFGFVMGEELDQAQAAPAAKRQRTDAGGGATDVDKQSNGAQYKQHKQKGQAEAPQKRRGNQKDFRILEMQQAVKVNNFKHAMKLFEELLAEGIKMQTHVVNALMFLACGGEQWERYVRGLPPLTPAEAAAVAVAAGGTAETTAGGEVDVEMGEGQQSQQDQQQQRKRKYPKPVVPLPEGPPPTRDELVAAMEQLWSYMGTAGLQPDQSTYLALARLEALKGNPQAALEQALECGNKGKPVQLRLFHPAQVGYCLAADVAELHSIDDLISKQKLDCTEYEYARLLEGIAAAGSYEQLKAVLLRMQSDLNQLAPATADFIAAFFDREPHAEPPNSLATCSNGGAAAAKGGATKTEGTGAAVAAEGAVAAAEEAATAAEGTGAEAAAAAAADWAAAPAAAEGAADFAAVTVTGNGAESSAAEAATAAAVAADAAGTFDGGSGARWRWRVIRDVSVAADGLCEAAGGQLRVIDLEDNDWEAFAAAIADLARTSMGKRSGDFDVFVEWYDTYGPYDILVDAANVAFFGQNFEGGGFNWRQVQDMYDMVRQKFQDKKILVMVHRKRINDAEAKTPDVQAFLDRLRRARSFYHTPPGANDDWFWLYACVRSKHNGILISNDELRDHIFSLLRPKHFLKWKERHIAHYAYSHAFGAVPGAAASTAAAAAAAGGPLPPPLPGPGRFALQLPSPYTSCVQQLAESGSWMVPVSGGTWLCIKLERAEG